MGGESGGKFLRISSGNGRRPRAPVSSTRSMVGCDGVSGAHAATHEKWPPPVCPRLAREKETTRCVCGTPGPPKQATRTACRNSASVATGNGDAAQTWGARADVVGASQQLFSGGARRPSTVAPLQRAKQDSASRTMPSRFTVSSDTQQSSASSSKNRHTLPRHCRCGSMASALRIIVRLASPQKAGSACVWNTSASFQ